MRTTCFGEIIQIFVDAIGRPFARALQKSLLNRVAEEERYRAGEYRMHLMSNATCPHHCLQHLCSAFNEVDFRHDCEHGRGDNEVISPPESMGDRLGRAPRPSDWQDHCFVCSEVHCAGGDDDSDDGNAEDENGDTANSVGGSLMCCEYCNRVAHKICMVRVHNDISLDRDRDWVCPDCVGHFDHLQHDQRCLACEQLDFIHTDIMRFGQLARAIAAHSESVTWGLVALESTVADLKRYIAHITRDVNQSAFQPFCTNGLLTWNSYTDLADYWARQSEYCAHLFTRVHIVYHILYMRAVCEWDCKCGVDVTSLMSPRVASPLLVLHRALLYHLCALPIYRGQEGQDGNM